MHVGTTVIFQGQGEGRTDREVYRNDLHLGDLAEPLGFDSLWGVEHHFTDYTMCPDVLQYLTYFAGRTQKIRLGSMVVVLPWHHPMRVAEQVSMLDHMSNGRVILGIGRGVARVEFGGFGLDQNNSRDMFVEFGQTILEGLERGYCELDGKMVKQERRNIRPRPFKSFRGRSYAAAVSPESMPIMAKLGVGLLIIPQKPWDQVTADLRPTLVRIAKPITPRRRRRRWRVGSFATPTRTRPAKARASISAPTINRSASLRTAR